MATDELAAKLQHAFPDLAVAPLRLLDVGFGSTVVETADGVVLRVARHARAAKGHAREARLLPQLRGRLPVAIPAPRWRVAPGEHFPFGVIGYRKLPGESLDPGDAGEAVAADVAAFIAQLHDIRDVDAPSYHSDPSQELHEATTEVLRRSLSSDEFDRLTSWWSELRVDERFRSYEPRLRHGDLWYENLLVEDGRLVGVIDWGTAEYADPAEDFDALRHVSDDFAEAVLAAYPYADADLRHRIERHWELRELWGISLALELGDEAELADGIRKLRAGPVLAGE
jgi:aminoglycoside phosphotransferase (APT) family kinase protein